MKTFAQNLMKLAPDWATLAPELIETFDWLEDQGWLTIRKDGQPEHYTLLIYPPELANHFGASHVGFGGTTLKYTSHWSTPNTEVDNRIFEIGTTSGDGGRLVLWLDEDGKQQFVQMGHDNAGIISDDPRVVLQFLAMGYPEPAALEQTDITPLQAFFDYHGVYDLDEIDPAEHPVAPTALQAFLKERFGLDMPATARAIGIADSAPYQDEETADPFNRWLAAMTPEPTQEELDYIDNLMRTVESLDLKDDDSSQTLMQKIGTLFKSKD